MATTRKTKVAPTAAHRQSRTPVTPTSASSGVLHEEIAKRAYEIWLASGSLHGRHEDHWLQAERELATSIS